ncbi:GPI mannosyltransferase [Penicillium griseofulvum]|uniref:Mannosyltransferase n=1 Tax=Penicillium patulum TaxID=5078 RepID=A0A135LP15_PENPA|nr:GPI mannosyltransferase [Penicillium griseofulvum]KXG50707.1 GPI mannosyltransferase [Penicillium griseofulvum]
MAVNDNNASGDAHKPRSKKQPPPPPFYIPLNIALYLFLAANTFAAIFSPIQDCDEVFNFWEPAHYLQHGYGLQTWEYSPVYSIRSWLYVSLHAAAGKIGSLVVHSKTAEFYTIRLSLAFLCAACQTRLYSAICRTLSPRIGLLFMMIVTLSPGMFHASTAFLPSTFTMYMSMLGLASFLDWKNSRKTAQGIMWFGLGTIVGWPFAGALIVPLLAEEAIVSILSGSLGSLLYNVFDGIIRCLSILALEIAIDYAFFRKLVLVPWNIVAYNILGGEGKGPEIFGTEPWTFYIRNLLLNFNVWFVLAMMSAPVLLFQIVFRSHTTSLQTSLRSMALVAPFYMWFGIFSVQPHKEERFMYPSYPFLALSAALSLHIILTYLGSTNQKELIGRVPTKLKIAVAMSVVLVALNAGMLRTLGMVTAYNAPLKVFEPLQHVDIAHAGDSVCFGKEWYRFPSSYFLPNNMRAKFIRSEFRGLLPGEFPDSPSYLGRLDGASQIPSGMNDLNIEDPGKYVDISQCSFLVDSYFPGHDATELEPHYLLDKAQWETLSCASFLDASQTEWTPSDFKRPTASPYPGWDAHSTKPIPYRPFRYGPKYYITLGLRSMKWDEWIELDNHYLKYHADKARRIEERGSKCCHTAPEAMDAAIELLEELCTYLPERYPSMFTKTATGISNKVTNETFNITQRPLPEDPMATAARLVQDDLALMIERPDGEYYLLAGAILLAGFWRLSDKFGMRLSDIHTSGDVPQFKSKLEKGMMNFFRRLRPEEPVLRNNYFIQVDDNLAWSDSIGSEDTETVSWDTAEKNRAIENHFFRSERQSLRRLPRSGAVVFTIRTYFEPVTRIVEEPYVPGRLADAIRSWGDDVSRYKGKEKYQDVLLEFLDEKHRMQVEGGLEIEREDEVRSYPL